MAIYRFDLQSRAPWPHGPQSFYYWTNVYYADVRDFTDYDYARDYVGSITNAMSHSDTREDFLHVIDTTDGTVIQNTNFTWPPNPLVTGPTISLENTVLAQMWSLGRLIGFKRYRVPVPVASCLDGYLTDEAWEYFNGRAQALLAPEARFCSRTGVFPDAVTVSRQIHGWQLRHGSKRSRYRRLHL